MKYKKYFLEFVIELEKRLEKGFTEYGDNSFNRSDEELKKEVMEELMDIVGWSFIRWIKIREKTDKKV